MAYFEEARRAASRHGDADLRHVFDALPAVISSYDRHLICRLTNKYHERRRGMLATDIVGSHVSKIVGQEIFNAWENHFETLRGGSPVAFEWSMPYPDGSVRDTAIRMVPRMTNGEFDGFDVLAFDVAAQEHRFHSVFDATAVGFVIVDVAGVIAELRQAGITKMTPPDILQSFLANDPSFLRRSLDGTPITGMNQKASEMFGIPPSEVAGVPLGRLCPDHSLPTFGLNLIEFMKGTAYFEAETVMKTFDGDPIDIILTAAYVRHDINDTSVILGTTDIRKRVARERELAVLQADLAHAARVATLGELAASIAHEVNQPLAAIIANGNAALRWLSRPEPDIREATPAIERSIAEANRASDIIKHMRALAKKQSSAREYIDANDIVAETVAFVQRQVVSLGSEILLELSTGPLTVTADRIQIQQVLINFVMNAAQAMASQDGPRVITIRSQTDGAAVCLDVSDLGPGIGGDPNKVFEPFYSTKASGMGMGLSISRTIVEAHGGTIWVTNRDLRGATIGFSLPAAQPTGQ